MDFHEGAFTTDGKRNVISSVLQDREGRRGAEGSEVISERWCGVGGQEGKRDRVDDEGKLGVCCWWYVAEGPYPKRMWSAASTPCIMVWSWFDTSYFHAPNRPRL